MEFAQKTTVWETRSCACDKRDDSPQSYAHYVHIEDEEAAFFSEDFDTIGKDVPRTHAGSFTHPDLNELIAKSEAMIENTSNGGVPKVAESTKDSGGELTSAVDLSLSRVLKAYVARNHNPGYAQVF